ncbi:hypothetical protein EH223_13585 [candidate division KSB1 bacterium]|nr:hypothetical protein [candidate division KSB1 bacterium]RQW02080.1 MAG: hypothetical protein EH223_13585 [candidate division KSB1 bacterium]
MKTKKHCCICLIGVFILFAMPLVAQEYILHNPPEKAQAGTDLVISCSIEGLQTSVHLARLFYRESKEEKYKYVFLHESGEEWYALIPGSDVQGQHLQYFLAFQLQDDRLLTFPEHTGQIVPEEILIVPASTTPLEQAKTSAEKNAPLQILTPEPDQIFEQGPVLIAVAISPDVVQADSVTLSLNGRNVTPFAVKSDYVISYEPQHLAPGSHRLIVTGIDKTGQRLAPVQLFFYVQEPHRRTGPRSALTGRVFTEGRYEEIYNQNESFAMGGAEFLGQYGSLNVRGRIFLTSLEHASLQPRDRFSLAVEHKHFNFEVGDVYPRYNDLMMWGKRVRGFAGGLSVGTFKIEAVFGQTYRAVEGQAVLSGDTLITTKSGTFEQNLFGIRPSLNFGQHVKAGLSVLKIKDDINSITYGVRPRDNIVIGPDVLISLDKGRAELRAYAAQSMLTLDTSTGVLSKRQVQNIFSGSVNVPIDPSHFQSLLVINDTTVPLNPLELTSFAYAVDLKLNYFRNLVRFGYKKIGSDYYSLANSWLRKDIRGFYLSDRVRLLQNKLYFTLGLERYADNISQSDKKPSLDLTTFDATLSYYPGKGLPNVSVSFRNYSRINGISDLGISEYETNGQTEIDTTDMREDSRQRDINIQLGYQVRFVNADHYFTVAYITAIKDDRFSETRLPNDGLHEMTSNVNMFTWSSTYDFPLRTTLSFSTNKNVIGNGLSDFRYQAISLFGEYKFFKKLLSTFAEFRYTKSNGFIYLSDVTRNHVRAGGILNLPARQTVTLETYVISLSGNATLMTSYRDVILRLRYEKLF